MLGVILLVQALTVAVSGSPTSMAYLPLRVAEAEGYFTREGLAVTLRSTRGEPEAAAALFDGTVDLAATSLETVARRAPPEVAPRLRLLVGLTAAPPVALLGTTAGADPPRVLASLARRLVGIGAPGADETWLAAILARARLSPRTVRITSLGTLELLRALESGEVAAGYVEAPYAAQLLATGRATLLADLRSAAAAAETLDAATVHAAVFGRVDRLPAPEALSAFTRALVAAEGRIVGADAADLATRLAPAASARPDEFAARLAASRGLFLPDPSVSAAQARASFGFIRERMPLPPFGHLPSPRELVELSRR